MASRKWIIAGLLGLAAPTVFAQQGRVAGPVAGYVFDGAARVVRPVLGIPGASVLGEPVDLGIAVATASVAPRLDSLLAVAADGSFHIFNLTAGAAKEAGVSGIAASPERIAFSPTGSAAALYAGGKIQIVTGLPASPAAGSTFDLSSLLALPGKGHRPLAGAFAVSDDGAYLLVAEGAGVQLFGPGGTRQIVSTRNTAVAFLPGSHDAAVAGSSVTLLKDVGGAATAQVLAESDPSLNSLGLAYSADATKLYLASSQGIAAFDLPSGTRTAIPCDCSPAGITGMGNVFRLNEAGPSPLWLLDANAATPRIVFVPVRSE